MYIFRLGASFYFRGGAHTYIYMYMKYRVCTVTLTKSPPCACHVMSCAVCSIAPSPSCSNKFIILISMTSSELNV